MNIPRWIKPLFVFAGLYDGILGILFLAMPIYLFNAAGVALPNHIGYVQFPAMLLIVFAILFFNIAKDPIANRNLILYGILLKVSYCSVIFPHWLMGNMPTLWVPFAFFDFAFLVIFVIVHKALKQA
jgi:hypothetical protein